ncbi:hypothetical protein GGI25_003153 [Coemansia spiralis]|uniref:Uncharacterized protein n=1 Tax=Coemansia spiralis TaxID=417178 RepID=A0A9W8G985_9FUNG|nr:hypothetical protein GGI25_003153 [Coemansia spiralis]
MALLFGIIAAVKFHSRKHWHIEVMHSESLIILLGLSMMLRAALTLPGGSRVGLYSASLFFNYYSGMCAYSGLVFGALSITKRRDPLSKRKTRMLFTSRILLSFVPSILLIIGVAFMFHPPAHNYVAGTRCIQTVLAIVIFVTLASAAVFIKRFSRIRLAVDKHNITSTIVYFVLLELWAVFMFSRTLVSLHSPARTSQVMFFLLNYLPLMIICLVSFTLDKPLALKYVRQNDNLEELVKATNDANHPADVGKKEPVSGDNNA